MTILATIVGEPRPADTLSPPVRAALESLSLDDWQAAAAIYTDCQRQAQLAALRAVPAEQAQQVGEAFVRFTAARYATDERARAVIDAAIQGGEQSIKQGVEDVSWADADATPSKAAQAGRKQVAPPGRKQAAHSSRKQAA